MRRESTLLQHFNAFFCISLLLVPINSPLSLYLSMIAWNFLAEGGVLSPCNNSSDMILISSVVHLLLPNTVFLLPVPSSHVTLHLKDTVIIDACTCIQNTNTQVVYSPWYTHVLYTAHDDADSRLWVLLSIGSY